MDKAYMRLGVVLTSMGMLIALISYFIIGSIPLTGIGLSTLIAGITCAGLAHSRPKLSPEACKLFLTAGIKNTQSILEEFGTSNKAIYLPKSMRNGLSQAIVPMSAGLDTVPINECVLGHVRTVFGPNQEDKAIIVTTPGNISLDLLEDDIQPTAQGIENALVYILSRQLDIADTVEVRLDGSMINVKLKHPEFDHPLFGGDVLYIQCIGSPIASITAAVCAESLGVPIKIVYENVIHESSYDVRLEILSASSPIYLEVV